MADWKKLVVSGSNISQLNNDSGYLTEATVGNGFATASYNGVDILADSSKGTLNFASASGEGLTIAADANTDTLTFGLSAIPNTSLQNPNLTIGNTSFELGDTVTTIDSLILTGTVASGSFSGSFQGDGSLLTGIASNLAITGSTGEGSIALKTQGLSILGTANEIETVALDQTITIGLPSDVTIGNNLTVTGDLFVNGTTTQINTTELLIEDKFILLASGSATAGDGGIIIDIGSDVGGNVAYGFDSATGRWGFQSGLFDSTNIIELGSSGDSAFAGYVFTEAVWALRPSSGEFVKEGAIYTATSGDIYIYS